MDDFDKKIQNLINDNLNITDEGKRTIDNTLRNLKTQKPNKTVFPIFNRISRIATIGILAASAVSVCAYTGGKIYEKMQEKNVISNISLLTGSFEELEKDMTSKGLWNYKIIKNYDEYIEFKNKNYGEILDMSEEDFEQNFLIVMYTTAYGDDGMNVYSIENKNNILEITLRKENLDKRNNENKLELINAKFDKELYSNNINITLAPILSKSDEFIDVLELPFDYTKEQAIKDSYVVLDNNEKIISDDKNAIDNFLYETQNGGKENQIRIVIFANFKHTFYVYDIYFKNGTYEIAITEFGYYSSTDEGFPKVRHTSFLTLDKIIRDENNDTITYNYNDGFKTFLEIKK